MKTREPFDPKTFVGGVLPSTMPLFFGACATLAGPVQESGARWDGLLNVVDDQGMTGTCEARAACGWMEVMIRNYADPAAFSGGKQLDAMAIHKTAWLMVNKGAKESDYSPAFGLPMGASFLAMRDVLGLLPKDAKLLRVGLAPGFLCQALEVAPVCMGTLVHDGWAAGKMNPDTGEIPWYMEPPNPGAGHAWLCTRVRIGFGGTPMVNCVNSWGEKEWGWHGIGQMRFDLLTATALDNPVQPMFDFATWFKESDAWKKFVV